MFIVADLVSLSLPVLIVRAVGVNYCALGQSERRNIRDCDILAGYQGLTLGICKLKQHMG